jgi:hypothetical protein
MYGFMIIETVVDMKWMLQTIRSDLSRHDVSVQIKDVQERDTVVVIGLVSVHHTADPDGILVALHDAMVRAESVLQRDGTNKAWKGLPLPTLSARFKNCRPPKAPPQTEKSATMVELKRNYSYLNNVLHIELTNAQYPRILAILQHMDTNAELCRLLGRNVGLVHLGEMLGKGEKEVQAFLISMRINLSMNVFNTSTTLSSLVNPGHKFRIEYQDGTAPSPAVVTLRSFFMDLMVGDTPEGLTHRHAFEAVIPVVKGRDAGGSLLVYFNDSKGTKHKKDRRLVNGPIFDLVERIRINGAAWAFHYMRNVLKYSEGTCRSAMQGFDERDRALVDEATWDGTTMSITTPFVRTSAHVEEGIAAMSAHGIDIFNMDLSGMVEDKAQIDAQDDERDAREMLVKQNRLYEDGAPKVGASGASARSGDSNVSSVAGSAKSTAEQNLCLNYQTNKVNLAREKGDNATLRAFLIAQGFDPDAALKTQPPPSKGASKKVRVREDKRKSKVDGTDGKGGKGEEMDVEGEG